MLRRGLALVPVAVGCWISSGGCRRPIALPPTSLPNGCLAERSVGTFRISPRSRLAETTSTSAVDSDENEYCGSGRASHPGWCCRAGAPDLVGLLEDHEVVATVLLDSWPCPYR